MKPDWKKKTVGHMFDVQLGKMLSEKAKAGPQVPYLANFNVRWGAFDLSKLNEMNFSDREKAKYSLQKGDLLMCEGGEIGRCAIWQGSDMEIYYQKALHRVRPMCSDVSADYLYFYMQFIASQGKLTRLVGETSIAHLTREKLLGLPITFPQRCEQKAIADLLSTWDKAIEKTERLIQAKEKRFKWLLRELISEPRNTQKDAKWKKVKIGSFLTESRISGTNGRDAQKITVKLYGKGVIAKDEKRIGSETTGIYATSIDYDPTLDISIEFFKTVQNKMHWAITGQTATEIIHERADADKPNMGLTNYRGAKVRKQDVTMAKNYLNEEELAALNNLVEQYLIFAQGRPCAVSPCT